MKKLFALLLALCVVFSLTACGGQTSTAEEATAPEEVAQTSEAVVEEAPAEESTEEAAPAEASVVEEVPVEEAGPQKVALELPIVDEPATYTIWYSEPFAEYVENPAEDVAVFVSLAERTNISFEFSLASVDTASEKFQLMFASDDLPDVITDAMQYYSGSIDDAVYEDAFLYDYSGDLESMPNYSYTLNQYIEAKKTLTSESGAMVSFPEMYQDIGDIDGFMIRKDFLEGSGLDIPTTYEEFHELLTVVHNQTGAGLGLSSSGGDSKLGAGFGINTGLEDEDISGWYLDGNTVMLGILQPEFYDYLEMVNQWYSEGIIYQDFVNLDQADLSGIFSGQVSINVKVPEIVEVSNKVIGVEMVAMAMPRQNADDELHICGGATSCLMDPNCWSINVNVDDPTPLLQLVDYMYSDEGYYLMNYGEEGFSYNMVDGEPVFTDIVIANPDGYDYALAAYLYATSNRTRLPFLSDYDRCFAQYTDAQWDAINIYAEDCDHACDYPNGAIMNTEQKDQYNSVASDISTYISENVLQFIYGQKALDEWDSFIETLYEMGIETAIEAKQAAYDDYLAA